MRYYFLPWIYKEKKIYNLKEFFKVKLEINLDDMIKDEE
jgi:hypothetical protein